jgi:hypothetical protein
MRTTIPKTAGMLLRLILAAVLTGALASTTGVTAGGSPAPAATPTAVLDRRAETATASPATIETPLAHVAMRVRRGDSLRQLLDAQGILLDGNALSLVYQLNPNLLTVDPLPPGRDLTLPSVRGNQELQHYLKSGSRFRVSVASSVKQDLRRTGESLQALALRAHELPAATWGGESDRQTALASISQTAQYIKTLAQLAEDNSTALDPEMLRLALAEARWVQRHTAAVLATATNATDIAWTDGHYVRSTNATGRDVNLEYIVTAFDPTNYDRDVAWTDGHYVRWTETTGRDVNLEYVVTAFDPTNYDRDILWTDGYYVRWPQNTSVTPHYPAWTSEDRQGFSEVMDDFNQQAKGLNEIRGAGRLSDRPPDALVVVTTVRGENMMPVSGLRIYYAAPMLKDSNSDIGWFPTFSPKASKRLPEAQFLFWAGHDGDFTPLTPRVPLKVRKQQQDAPLTLQLLVQR